MRGGRRRNKWLGGEKKITDDKNRIARIFAYRPAAATVSRTFIEPEPVPSPWPRPGIVRGRFQCHSRRPPKRAHTHAHRHTRTHAHAHTNPHARARAHNLLGPPILCRRVGWPNAIRKICTYHRRPNIAYPFSSSLRSHPFLPSASFVTITTRATVQVFPRIRTPRTRIYILLCTG